MNCAANFPPPARDTAPDPRPGFDVVIAYQDLDTGKQAKKTLDYLSEKLGQECRFSSQMWKFDVLAMPSLRNMAVQDAEEADIILISCHGDADLPVEVKAWIELWIGSGGHHLALVALLDCPNGPTEKTKSLIQYLEQVAWRGQMEFFVEPDMKSGGHLDAAAFAAEGAERFAPTGTFSRWGINE